MKRDMDLIRRITEAVAGDGPPRILICRLGPLTWQGHEQLEAMRLKRSYLP